MRVSLSGLCLLLVLALPAGTARAQENRCYRYCGEFAYVVPDLRGKTVAAASAQCSDLSIQASRALRYSDNYTRGEIAAQRPRPGNCISVTRKTITVTVSRGSARERVCCSFRGRNRMTSLRRCRSMGGRIVRESACRRPSPRICCARRDWRRPRMVPADQCRRQRGRPTDPAYCQQPPPTTRPSDPFDGIPLDELGELVETYSNEFLVGLIVLAVLAMLSNAGTSRKKGQPPHPARFAVRPRVDPGRQKATAPDRVETRGGDDG